VSARARAAADPIQYLRWPDSAPAATVLIPSLDGDRSGNLKGLIEDLEQQTFQDFELLVVVGVTPNGHARNVGAAVARGAVLICIDDDMRLGHERVLELMVKALNEHPEFGVVGISDQIPPDASWLQRRMAAQIPRSLFPIVDDFVDSDMVSHHCLALRRAVWDEVGGESDTLVRGTDPDLRYRIRKAGYRVVIVPQTWGYHPHPKTLSGLMRQWYKQGAGAADVFLTEPHMAIDTPDSFQEKESYRRSFPRRVSDSIGRLLATIFKAQEISLLCQAAYALGYITHVMDRKLPSARSQ